MGSAGAASLGWGLALRQAAHVAEDQLPEVRDAGAAEVIGLAVEVIHLLGGQLNGDALATGGRGPGGHGVGCGFSHSRGCGCGT